MDVCFREMYFALLSFSPLCFFNPAFYMLLEKYGMFLLYKAHSLVCNKVSGASFTTEISYIGILITVWINHCGLQKTTDE